MLKELRYPSVSVVTVQHHHVSDSMQLLISIKSNLCGLNSRHGCRIYISHISSTTIIHLYLGQILAVLVVDAEWKRLVRYPHEQRRLPRRFRALEDKL